VNDVLIAASCREAGARLVTENVGDYAAVQRHLRGFRFIAADEVVG
jgi:predicted nucleic acid-binding protein